MPQRRALNEISLATNAWRLPLLLPRGGSTAVATSDEEEENEEEKKRREEQAAALKKWRMDQQVLLQLRSTFLSEALAARGIPISTLAEVSTAEGDKPPESVDWDCAMSTVDEPKTCLYSFDAEPNTKVVAPIGSSQWISLSALNRLRRTDPTKVEPMWHSRYSILRSWFSDNSEFSLLQHVGFKGFIISTLLLDLGNGMVLRSLLALGLVGALIVFMPVLEYLVNRLLVSGVFWAWWPSWSRIARAALPLKLLIGQMAWKFVAGSFAKLENKVKEYVVDMECEILEESVPLTVGPGSFEEEEEANSYPGGDHDSNYFTEDSFDDEDEYSEENASDDW